MAQRLILDFAARRSREEDVPQPLDQLELCIIPPLHEPGMLGHRHEPLNIQEARRGRRFRRFSRFFGRRLRIHPRAQRVACTIDALHVRLGTQHTGEVGVRARSSALARPGGARSVLSIIARSLPLERR